MLRYYRSLFSWREVYWPASDWAGRIGVLLAVGLAIATLLATRQDEPVIGAWTLAWITVGVLLACILYALLRTNYEKYVTVEAAGVEAVKKLRGEMDANESASRQRISDLQSQVDDLSERLKPKLLFQLGEGGHYKERGGVAVYYRVGLRTLPGVTVEGVQVRVNTCDRPGNYWHLGAPLLMRGRMPDDILRHGITVNSGNTEYPQLIEAHYDGNRLRELRPSHVLDSSGYMIRDGTYTIELVASGKISSEATLRLRITVQSNQDPPISIEPA